MRPEVLIPKNPGVEDKFTFSDGYDFKDIAFLIGFGIFVGAVYLAPILIIFENDPEFKLVYQCISAFAIWVIGSVGLIKKWFGNESAWKIVVDLVAFLFRKKRHVFYVLEEVNLNQTIPKEKSKEKKVKNKDKQEKDKSSGENEIKRENETKQETENENKKEEKGK